MAEGDEGEGNYTCKENKIDSGSRGSPRRKQSEVREFFVKEVNQPVQALQERHRGILICAHPLKLENQPAIDYYL